MCVLHAFCFVGHVLEPRKLTLNLPLSVEEHITSCKAGQDITEAWQLRHWGSIVHKGVCINTNSSSPYMLAIDGSSCSDYESTQGLFPGRARAEMSTLLTSLPLLRCRGCHMRQAFIAEKASAACCTYNTANSGRLSQGPGLAITLDTSAAVKKSYTLLTAPLAARSPALSMYAVPVTTASFSHNEGVGAVH